MESTSDTFKPSSDLWERVEDCNRSMVVSLSNRATERRDENEGCRRSCAALRSLAHGRLKGRTPFFLRHLPPTALHHHRANTTFYRPHPPRPSPPLSVLPHPDDIRTQASATRSRGRGDSLPSSNPRCPRRSHQGVSCPESISMRGRQLTRDGGGEQGTLIAGTLIGQSCRQRR